jgi:hypothetical protein
MGLWWHCRKAREEAAKDIVMGLSEGLSGLDGETPRQ